MLQLKSNDYYDYYENDNIRLLTTFQSEFKIFQINMSRRKEFFILWANKGHGQSLMINLW